MIGIVFLEEFVNLHRAVGIFLIPPASDVEIWHGWFLEDVRHGFLLPESVVIVMRDEILPGGQGTVDVVLVGVGERAEAQIPLVGVELIELKNEICFAGLHHGGVFEAVTESAGALVMNIDAEKHVGGGSLFGNGFQRGMGLEHAHYGDPASV